MFFQNNHRSSEHLYDSWNSDERIVNLLLKENQEWAKRVDSAVLTPPLDILESERSFTVTVDLPGIHPDDVIVEISERSLRVHAEKRSTQDMNNGVLRRVERGLGFYSRAISLPTAVNQAEADFSYRDGVLTLTLPKKSKASIRPIAIEVIN